MSEVWVISVCTSTGYENRYVVADTIADAVADAVARGVDMVDIDGAETASIEVANIPADDGWGGDDLARALRRVEYAAAGDSNDWELDALRDALSIAVGLLKVEGDR